MSQSSPVRVQRRLKFIDSHTAGEPTRIVLDGFPAIPGATLAEQRQALSRDFDAWRSLINNEPRGNDVLVSALLLPPRAPDCAAGVIFFNNVGPLNMCGHGTIGLVSTLAYLGRIEPGEHRIDTPVGVVSATLHEDGRVSVQNVPAYRHSQGVTVVVPGIGEVRGDVAWGGNWFFLTDSGDQDLTVANVEALTDHAWRVRQALEAAGITGADGAEIDHIELFGHVDGVSRNFVLCPGKAYDRSPCGTGTSAKMACLAADGLLAPGQRWVQQSVIGTEFEGQYHWHGGALCPTITGQAFITAEGELIVQPGDPFAWGIRADAPDVVRG
ncbi:proline racemase family protein [Deinococcus deserti]|uniref:Putative proline racemase n=1 Tax=Deinococcus deserti (strain DSM 17065 / CIP 109153 / LMG 22923 / VCD115) TaxID=546414 RepID=C1D1Z2_DEIDV|nr:proline racemase family protein [Deinococcus deserti]ACO47431.1 putative proline racemase [Deinococcus deserti VCD115]